MAGLTLSVVPGRFAVCRFEAHAALPAWVFKGVFSSVTRTAEELSIVCREDVVPDDVPGERGWTCLKVEGPLDFSLTGVMASLAEPLAAAEISLFALSTYNTDYLLVKATAFNAARDALMQAGHVVLVAGAEFQ